MKPIGRREPEDKDKLHAANLTSKLVRRQP